MPASRRTTAQDLPPEGFFLFTANDLQRVIAGDLTVTWRLWKYAHVKAGRAYPAASGAVVIDDIRTVRVDAITDRDARNAGLPNAQALIDLARAHKNADVTPDTLLYRVQFHYTDQPPPKKPPLPLDQIAKRLARLDVAAPAPWTLTTLRLIEENPGTVSTTLAHELDMPRLDFKANVRKLKSLGLTISHMVGYEISPLGQTYLDSVDA